MGEQRRRTIKGWEEAIGSRVADARVAGSPLETISTKRAVMYAHAHAPMKSSAITVNCSPRRHSELELGSE